MFDPLPQILLTAPQLELLMKVVYASTNDQVQAIGNGSLDLGFVTPPIDTVPRMRSTMVSNEPLLAALPDAMAGPAEQPIPLQAVHDRLIMFPPHGRPAPP